jgi:hypothetical protein
VGQLRFEQIHGTLKAGNAPLELQQVIIVHGFITSQKGKIKFFLLIMIITHFRKYL